MIHPNNNAEASLREFLESGATSIHPNTRVKTKRITEAETGLLIELIAASKVRLHGGITMLELLLSVAKRCEGSRVGAPKGFISYAADGSVVKSRSLCAERNGTMRNGRQCPWQTRSVPAEEVASSVSEVSCIHLNLRTVPL